MIARIIDYSARNPFFVVLLMAATIAGGIWAIKNTPLDAIPDLSDVQVIVYTTWSDRSPDIIEDQVTYPIVTQARFRSQGQGCSSDIVLRLFAGLCDF